MKIINSNIILENGDELIISMIDGGLKTIAKCVNNMIHIDDISLERIKEIKEENEAIKIMEDYLKQVIK